MASEGGLINTVLLSTHNYETIGNQFCDWLVVPFLSVARLTHGMTTEAETATGVLSGAAGETAALLALWIGASKII